MARVDRRGFLRGTLGAAAALGAAAGLLHPVRVLAEWPAARFAPRGVDQALADLTGESAAVPSDAITLRVPDTASDARSVPVTVEAALPVVTAIWLLVAENAVPVVAGFQLGPEALPFVSLRTKMAMTSDVIALVRSQGTLYEARARVQVASGEGCAA
jgi:sulfur-oxidizing protein SoxY